MKQPHEDILRPADVDTRLLGFDDAALDFRDAICALASHLYLSCMVGNPAPAVLEKQQRMLRLEPGDYVVESSDLWRRWGSTDAADRAHRFGVLLERRDEWGQTDEEHRRALADGEIDADEERWVERNVVYIQYGPSPEDVCRWVNCSFIVVPVDLFAFHKPVVTAH